MLNVCRFRCVCKMYPVSNGSTWDLMFVCFYINKVCLCRNYFFFLFKGESLLCDICFWCFPVVSVSECEHFDIFCICTWLRGIVAYTWTKNKVSYKVIVKFTENCVFIVERELTGKQVRKMKGLEGWINLVCAFEVRINCVFIEKY